MDLDDFEDRNYIDVDSSDSTNEEKNVNEDIDNINEEEQVQDDNHETDNENESTTTKKRSWVWEHSLKKARCNICKALITTSKGSTTGMSNHLKTKHKLSKDSNEKQQSAKSKTINITRIYSKF